MKIEKQNNSLILVILAVTVALCILFKSIADSGGKMVSPLAPTPTVTPTPTIDPTSDPLIYLRWKGQQEGYDDYTISKLIRVFRCESGFNLDEKALGKHGDSGVAQIIPGTWLHYGCSGDPFTFKDNIDCAYKIFGKSGFSPWVCARKLGIVNN